MIESLIWAITLIVILLSLFLMIFLSPFSETVKRYAQMREKISNDKKEIELKKLSIIEKNPEAVKMIFNK